MRIKVLHLIDSGGLYGAERMLLGLVQEQLKQGLEPMILSAGEPDIGEKAIEAEAKRKSLPFVPWRMTPGLNLRESRKILKWASDNEYDLLHSHGFKFNVLLGTYPEYIRQIPMIATLHGYVHAPLFSKMWLYESLDRIALRLMRGVVLVGEAMKTELPRRLLRGQFAVIPNGLNISELEESSLTPLDEPFKSFFASHEPVVLGVGRLSREKGFDRLISGFSELKGEFPKAGLIIVGEGRLREQLEAMIDQLSMKDDVLMPGYCSAVPSLLRKSEVLVMPSLTEGLPITLLEAMSLKTPVVASAVGEIPKVLGGGKGGEILSDGEPKTISTAIGKSVTDKELSARKAHWSCEAVGVHFSSGAMAGHYLAFYQRVLGTL